ncbi:hypothetical protein [Bradyrhizobium sp.]|uniref:hypothetical protein n=1 Tax=Bradyrhizobium sp. TaxID=376 RepID=UPI003C2292D7
MAQHNRTEEKKMVGVLTELIKGKCKTVACEGLSLDTVYRIRNCWTYRGCFAPGSGFESWLDEAAIREE